MRRQGHRDYPGRVASCPRLTSRKGAHKEGGLAGVENVIPSNTGTLLDSFHTSESLFELKEGHPFERSGLRLQGACLRHQMCLEAF